MSLVLQLKNSASDLPNFQEIQGEKNMLTDTKGRNKQNPDCGKHQDKSPVLLCFVFTK